MIRAGILIALVATVAVGLSSAYEECTESIPEDPFAGSTVYTYALEMFIEPGSPIVGEKGSIFIEHGALARDVVVLHADKSIEVDGIEVKKIPRQDPVDIPRGLRVPRGSRMVAILRDLDFKEKLDKLGVAIESVCRDSSRQLLVIKLGEKLELYRKIEVKFSAKVPLRDDGKGLHKLENGVIRADFANSEARLIMPCIDDEKSKSRPSHFLFELMTSYRLTSAPQDFKRLPNNGKDGKIRLASDGRSTLEWIWFELKP